MDGVGVDDDVDDGVDIDWVGEGMDGGAAGAGALALALSVGGRAWSRGACAGIFGMGREVARGGGGTATDIACTVATGDAVATRLVNMSVKASFGGWVRSFLAGRKVVEGDCTVSLRRPMGGLGRGRWRLGWAWVLQ